jgi:hypothetical protein
MTWGKRAAEAQEAIAQRELADLDKGIVPDSWMVLGKIIRTICTGTLTPQVAIMDIGCGVGSAYLFLEYFMPGIVGRYFGIDTNQAALDIAVRQARGDAFLNQDISKVAYPFAYPFVLSNGTLNHIDNYKAALVNMAMSSSHWLILHRLWVHHDEMPTEMWSQEVYGEEVPHLRINESEMVNLLDGLGFKLLEKTSSDGSGKLDEGWTYVFERRQP